MSRKTIGVTAWRSSTPESHLFSLCSSFQSQAGHARFALGPKNIELKVLVLKF